MQRREQQRQFFETFGYVVLPGVLRDDIGWITEEFEAVFTDRGITHDGLRRSMIVPFIDQRARLSTLLDHPVLLEVAENLLGADFNYLGGDGNYYTGDTNWHSDGFHTVGLFLKAALYLDPVGRDTGCLRVIPGSHQIATHGHWRQTARSHDAWDIEPSDVPSVALESTPGDLVVFNHNLQHAAFGGSAQRRMFTLNLCRHCRTQEEIADLEAYIGGHDRLWIDSLHSSQMRETASPERWRHLRQVMEHEGHLPARSAQARARMAEPSRG